jgi:hypothetical protein
MCTGFLFSPSQIKKMILLPTNLNFEKVVNVSDRIALNLFQRRLQYLVFRDYARNLDTDNNNSTSIILKENEL